MSFNSPNKVEFGLKNVHYATLGMTGTTVTYGAPVPIPGGVNLTMSPEGDKTTFRADNRIYYEKSVNNGYTGDLEVARIPEPFKRDVLNQQYDAAKGIFYEDATKLPSAFALLFEIDGDATQTRYVYYNVTPERPEQDGETTGETLDPKTEVMEIAARPSVDRNIVKAYAMATDTASSTAYSNWFTAVQLPTV